MKRAIILFLLLSLHQSLIAQTRVLPEYRPGSSAGPCDTIEQLEERADQDAACVDCLIVHQKIIEEDGLCLATIVKKAIQVDSMQIQK